ncbi:membrane-bound PQQ-dependent dehydrogenase, glucose/quinate/shikimate family [Luteimonas suaedae]|uniref:membrane-bound PQQ-dependent dehydrogenase, glucose/quinate/shikimate family n=1 Tax=Luteimonas suaedae TaxID=2605430 RepID=UPI0011ED0C7C|nr:membrane-bound PQQ-dependent dehydrogenase, glucose/quinate/shikimate family [Luteimonas suaedae]
MSDASNRRRPNRWWPALVGTVVVLLGLVLACGGGWLLLLGGSWYYLVAGLGLIVAGVLLIRGRMAGAWWYAGVLLLTFAWSGYESGLDYWRWVPRAGLLTALGIVVALLAPGLDRGISRRAGWSAAGVLVLVFVVAFALAFVPRGITRGGDVPAAAAVAAADTIDADAFVQAADAPAAGDWAAYGRDNAATRFTPLARITRDNVSRLERVWEYRTGDLPNRRWGAETTPLKVGDSLYLCSARNILIALDARSGRERWRYDPEVPNEYIPYTAACRGVTYYTVPPAPVPEPAEDTAPTIPGLVSEAETDAGANLEPAADPEPTAAVEPVADGVCATRIIEGTLDGRLIAVDARTGTPCPGFGDNGEVDITVGMGKTPPGYVSITSPPTIVRDVIVTGHQVLDGQQRDMPSGVIQGFDAVTGELRWAWDMVRPDRSGRPPEGETYTRGTPNMWTTASGDERLGLVYLPMGNAAADYLSADRSAAENEYSTSLVALDVTTGKPAWHFQTVHVDVWDYDLGSQGTLVDFPSADGPVPALVLPTKQGDLYVLDRRTGQPLTGVEERPVPQGGVEPDQRSPTQPFSRFHTLRKPDLTERDMWGISPIDQLVCRIGFRRASYQGIYTPPTTERHWIQYPGYNGGSDWGGIAIDPQRGVIIANYNDMPNHNRLVPREEVERRGWLTRAEMDPGEDEGGAEGGGDPQVGTDYGIEVNAGWRMHTTKLLCKQPPYGGIRAIALDDGRTLWDRPFGTARANGPFGIRSGLPIVIGTPNNGGAAVTAGGLIFIASATDDLIRAIDIETGETLWQDALPAGGQAGPAVYEVDGRQYLVIMTGGHHFMETPAGDQVIAYAIPQPGETPR